MKIKKLTFTIFLISLFFLNISLVVASYNANNNLTNYFRIHVVANSDSIDDQILKLNVAKAVNEYIDDITKDITNKNEYIECIWENIYNILNVANNKMNEENKNYNIVAYVGKMKYSEKSKDGITQPKGTYNSLKIVIGDGNGENWWSLLFPNSIQGISSEDVLANDNITFSFGITEWFKDLFN